MVIMTAINSNTKKLVDCYETNCDRICHACSFDVHGNVAGTSKLCCKQSVMTKLKDIPLVSYDSIVSPRTMNLIKGSSRDAVGSLKAMQDFELLELLGQGFFGMVYKVREKSSSSGDVNFMVMKIPIVHNQSCPLSAKKIVIKEDYMLRLLVHPNILESRGICVQHMNSQWQLNLLVDFCDAGSLQQLILNTQKSFSWLERCRIALDVCQAMSYVHKQGFMHRDLTSMNILLKTKPYLRCVKAVVADFGLSSKIPQYPNILQQVGTQNWMAPEMLKEKFYNEKSDIFSFGIIMCQMIARIDADHDAGLYRTPMFGLDYVRFIARCPFETPLSLLKIAFMCCVWNPDSRPSFANLVNQFIELVDQNIIQDTFLHDNIQTPEEMRLGRSRSDAAIRGINNLASPLFSSTGSEMELVPCYTPRRKCGWKNSFSFVKPIRKPKFSAEELSICEKRQISSFIIYEGVIKNSLCPSIEHSPIISNSPEVLVFMSNENGKGNKASNRLKELAKFVADGDPNYQESEQNPFSAHSRYRFRKMKPTSLFRLNFNNAINQSVQAPTSKNFLDECSKLKNFLMRKSTKFDCQDSIENKGKNTTIAFMNERMDESETFNENLCHQEKTYVRHRSFSLPPSFYSCFNAKFPSERLNSDFTQNGNRTENDMFKNFYCHYNKNKSNNIFDTNDAFVIKSDIAMNIPLPSLKKKSVTLGLGEQRTLQGRITFSFRDYDYKFTSKKFVSCKELEVFPKVFVETVLNTEFTNAKLKQNTVVVLDATNQISKVNLND